MTKEHNYTFTKEVIFQLLLNMLLFFSYAIESDKCNIQTYHFFYYINYAIGALVINYVLLPYFYHKKYILFFTYLIILLFSIMMIEEEILEQIYFPDNKGAKFGNILHNLLDILPTLLILTGFKFAWDASKKQQEVNHLKGLVKESELQFLKTQINPHFLFNNLNNLYSYSIENSSKTSSIILELSSVLRYMLYDCKGDFVSLSKEIEHVENFTKLNQLQIEDRGLVKIDIKPVTNHYKIAPLILNVFIENAFKHSTATLSNKIFISIDMHMKNDILYFKCKNSYGTLSNHDNLPKGIGLQNVKKRLNFLYENAHQLDIKEKDNLYIVNLQLQLTKQ